MAVCAAPDDETAIRHGRFPLDLAASRVVAEIAVGRKPVGVAVAPDEKLLYVTNRDSNAELYSTKAMTD